MSILGQAAAGEVASYIVLTLLMLAGMGVAWRLGFFRTEGVLGPERAQGRGAGWPILVMLLVGTTAWLGTQIALATYKQVQWQRAGHEGQFQMTDLTAGDYAFLSTVPGIVGVAAVLVCLGMYGERHRPRLGIEPGKFPSGVVKGIGAILIIMPLIFWVSEGTEWVYRAVNFKHPSEHDLLRAMKESGTPAIRWMLVIGAVLVAPVVEELLFRGLFQTLLVWAFNNRARRADRAEGFPVVTAGMEGTVPGSPLPVPGVVDPMAEALPPATPGRLALGRWLAILVTSMVFAGIHERWSVPPIFVLSICLGFAYERTGNLWVNMSIHALFNGLQTLIFLTLLDK
jgi:membrane protease YdiL (CAAX protease family)